MHSFYLPPCFRPLEGKGLRGQGEGDDEGHLCASKL